MAINTMTIPVRLERVLYEKVKSISESDKRSMSNWTVIAIEKEIKRYEDKESDRTENNK